MNIRLQTWFPYHIQVCLNGREWLRRSLEQEGIEFQAKGNKFLHIGDYEKAQQLLDQQLDIRFAERLNSFLPVVFPAMTDILGPYYSYYWTLWQSEWATDLIFTSPDKLAGLMDSLLHHAHITGTSTAVLRYLDRPLTRAGNPYQRSTDEVVTRMTGFNDGIRLRHWVDQNSVKLYNEQNGKILRSFRQSVVRVSEFPGLPIRCSGNICLEPALEHGKPTSSYQQESVALCSFSEHMGLFENSPDRTDIK